MLQNLRVLLSFSVLCGVTGGQEVVDNFVLTYCELYNSAGSEVEMDVLKKRIQSTIQLVSGQPTSTRADQPGEEQSSCAKMNSRE
jgi:hypothetical protein